MIVVTGSVVARQDTFDEVRRLSLEHVHRSRDEPGCISHAVHVDCENALRLVFIEQWADRAALLAHFAVPASRDFVRALQPLAAAATTIELYDATKLEKLRFAWLCCPTNSYIALQHWLHYLIRTTCEANMSEDWNTKYGPRRVRRDPPTLDEAIFAAVGITDDQEAQAEIAAALMGLPIEDVQAEVKKAARPTLGRSTTRVIAGEQGAQRSIVVERRIVRKFGNDKRTGT
jgi:quinol monooxygenase YgiN